MSCHYSGSILEGESPLSLMRFQLRSCSDFTPSAYGDSIMVELVSNSHACNQHGGFTFISSQTGNNLLRQPRHLTSATKTCHIIILSC